MRRKSFRRLRISLRHRWIAGESISYLRVSLFRSVGVGFSSSLSAFSVSTCAAHAPDREIRERRFPNGQNSKSQKTQICFHFVFFFPSKIKLLFLRTRTTTTGLSLSLSLSLLRSHRHVRSRFVRALFALKCEGHKCLFPSSKGRKNYYLACFKNPKFTSRKKRGWTRDLFFPPQSIFSSSSKSSTSTTTCRHHQLLYSTTTTVAFTRL